MITKYFKVDNCRYDYIFVHKNIKEPTYLPSYVDLFEVSILIPDDNNLNNYQLLLKHNTKYIISNFILPQVIDFNQLR